MNNEILWAQLIVLAWQNPSILEEMQDLAGDPTADPPLPPKSANAFLIKMATRYNLPQPNFANNVQTQIVIDTPDLVHLIMPPYQNIPPSSIDMVPHAL
jgi:hypothetical protein